MASNTQFANSWNIGWTNSSGNLRSGPMSISLDPDGVHFEGTISLPGADQSTYGTCAVVNDDNGNPAGVVYSGNWQSIDGSDSGTFDLLISNLSPGAFAGYYLNAGSATAYPWVGTLQGSPPPPAR